MPATEPLLHSTMPGTWRAWWYVYVSVLAASLLAHLPQFVNWVNCNPVYGYPGLLEMPPQHLLPGGCKIDGNDGTTLQAWGGRAAEMWLHGRLPWWNSYAGLGLPLAAEAQPAAFFLPFILLLHFFAGIVILKLVLQVLAGACAVAMFREMGLCRAAAATGAILFALNGSFAWFADSPILPIAFLPALLFGLERCRNQTIARQAGGPLWVALALAYSLVAGFPETAFMDGLLASLWAAVAVARTPPDRRWTLIAKILCGGVVGLALSAPAWVSFLDYLRIASVGAHAQVTNSHLVAHQAAALLLPGVYGPPYADWAFSAWSADGGYFGPVLTILALTTLCAWRPGIVRSAMAGWILFWLAVFFGVPVAHALWAAFKPLNEVWITRYSMPSLECAATILAALTVDDWCRSRQRVRGWRGALVFVMLALVTLTLAAQAGRLSIAGGLATIFLAAAMLEAAIVAAVLPWLLAGTPDRGRVLLLAAVATMDATAHFILPELAGTRPNRLALKPVEYLQAHVGLARVYALNNQLPSNYASWFDVASIQANSLPFAQAWDDAAVAIGGDINFSVNGWLGLTPAEQLAAFRISEARLRAAGVRFVVVNAASDPFVAQNEPGMVAVYQDARTRIYDMPTASPYFEAQGGPCQLMVQSRERLQTRCAAPALLLRRELMLPGWHASINGAKAAIDPGATPDRRFFQQVALTAGQADVQWWYAPPHASVMGWLFVFGLAATAWMAVSGARFRIRKVGASASIHPGGLPG